jgi:YfiH family protein
VQANQHRALAALGWRREDVATCYQVHGVSVGVIGWDDRGQIRPATDALVTATPGVMLMLRFADCVPLMFYDRHQRVIGLAHAGWRGVAVGLVQATVRTLVEVFGCRPADLWAGVGPSIGPCCYQVGHEVVESVRAAVHGRDPFHQVDGHAYLDLWAAVTSQLTEAGVERIELAGLCTACHTDEWFSHRAEEGKTGRFGVVIALKGQTEAVQRGAGQ